MQLGKTKNGTIRHMFPGGNTSKGFFSYYNYIISQEEAKRIFIIKGGPGVGKSTFMKKIGQEMLDRGYSAEYMHCSSDNNSLDGIVFPELKIAMLDGTAPHIVDPKNPGAVDEIINLGEYWDEAGMRKNKNSILEVNREIGTIFARAYRYLKAAAAIYEDLSVINSWAADEAGMYKLANELIQELMGNTSLSDKRGKQRCLFASAITPGGLKNYLNTIIKTDKVFILGEVPGQHPELILEKIKEAALFRGLDVECYYCALLPNKLEHLVIQDIGAFFTSSNYYHHVEAKGNREINLSHYMNNNVLNKYRDEITYNISEFDDLLKKSIETISKAKALHDRLETYFIPNMDFEAVQRCQEAVLCRILEYAGETC